MIRTVIYLILFILTIIFLFQNGGQPVTLKFLNWETYSIPVGFVFISALLIGTIVVWLYHLPQIIILKNKLKSFDRKITLLMEEVKRKENELNEIKKTKEELEKKLSKKEEIKTEEKKLEAKETETMEKEEEKEKKKNFLFNILKRKKINE
ncbi:MAG: hypothetical protein ACUVQN_02245 [Caldisericia bacterium]